MMWFLPPSPAPWVAPRACYAPRTVGPRQGGTMERTLVVLRHAKSDWTVAAEDRERPLAARGRRQAPASGRWLATHLPRPDRVVVSVATRARQTWDLVAPELTDPPAPRASEAAYTFSGDDLAGVVAEQSPDVQTLVLVGHNPALEELLAQLTGHQARL